MGELEPISVPGFNETKNIVRSSQARYETLCLARFTFTFDRFSASLADNPLQGTFTHVPGGYDSATT
jgi:hypothetical protein